MKKSELNENVDSLVSALENTKVSSSGVSFAGKSLKLDTEEDAKPVIEEINNSSDLEYLNLEGNTLGVAAAKAIAEALEIHPEFKKALWKDMFTGRMKTEIPKALEFLGNGLVKAGARLTELDLSDNAFGPIGVQGLAALLKSPTCYALEELRLNNNGLGITGGKILASALTDCYNSSKNEGKPLALRVFIAGRNRLENDGAKALAAVFKMIGTLEEIAMPQNGIYYTGITVLCEAFTDNQNLQILNLNDNTLGPKGAEAIASALPSLQNLRVINLGDCLLRTKGALVLAKALKSGHEQLEELLLGFNEIKKSGGLALAEAMANKNKLRSFFIDGNQFGNEGIEEIKKKFKEIGKLNTVGSLYEDEGESEEEVEKPEDEPYNSEESVKYLSFNRSIGDFFRPSDHLLITPKKEPQILQETKSESSTAAKSIREFLRKPNGQNLLSLGPNREELILQAAKENRQIDIDRCTAILMKVSSVSDDVEPEVTECATKISENLYKELFTWAEKQDAMSIVNNTIMVNLGLLKSEDRTFRPTWNLTGCFKSLRTISKLNFFPESTRDTLRVFLQRDIDRNGDHRQLKQDILAELN